MNIPKFLGHLIDNKNIRFTFEEGKIELRCLPCGPTSVQKNVINGQQLSSIIELVDDYYEAHTH